MMTRRTARFYCFILVLGSSTLMLLEMKYIRATLSEAEISIGFHQTSGSTRVVARQTSSLQTVVADYVERTAVQWNEFMTSNEKENDYAYVIRQQKHQHQQQLVYDPLALSLGDLPGYTGWARPARTTAAWYTINTEDGIGPYSYDNSEMKSTTLNRATVGEPWTIRIYCNHKECQGKNPLFDLRAYGPAVLPGIVTQSKITLDNESGSSDGIYHDVTFHFLDPGRYVVEVVLAFSHVPDFNTYPQENEPLYEGYLLKEFPMSVNVFDAVSTSEYRDKAPRAFVSAGPSGHRPLPNSDHKRQERRCRSNDILETSDLSAIERGRWSVVHRARGQGAMPEADRGKTATFQGYKHGFQSLGFRMEYLHQTCSLEPLTVLANELKLRAAFQKIHIVLVGDSNMDAQHKVILSTFRKQKGVNVTFFRTYHGLPVRLPQIRQDLIDVSNHAIANNETTFVLFNSGLHDIARFCTQRFKHFRYDAIRVSDDSFSCAERYRQDLTELVRIIQALPFRLAVFQTTSAGWIKWGNVGVSWKPSRKQEFPQAHQACQALNNVAWEVMTSNRVPVMDAYWLTVARPDHREIDRNNTSAKKLVHAGVEIYNVLVRKWLRLILDASNSTALAPASVGIS